MTFKVDTPCAWRNANYRLSTDTLAVLFPKEGSLMGPLLFARNAAYWPEVRVSNSVKLCLYSCRERQITGQTQWDGLLLP